VALLYCGLIGCIQHGTVAWTLFIITRLLWVGCVNQGLVSYEKSFYVFSSVGSTCRVVVFVAQEKVRVLYRCTLHSVVYLSNPLTPNEPYRDRTAPLTSKRCILYIYSTNIGTEYFKHGIQSRFFSSSKCSLFHNSNVFGSCIIHILYTECAKI